MSLAPAHTLLRTHMRMRALHSVGQQTQAQQRRSLRSSSRTYASSSSGSGSGSGSAPSDADLSRAAFAQRQLLSSLRASSSSSASALGAASPPADPHANARAALSGAGARGGMSMGLGLGLGTGMGSGDGTGGTLDRAAGGGKKWKELRGGQKVVRAGLTTSRLLLVLVGGGLTIAVGWAVGSELFASNSPTVIYNDAVKRVRRSGQIQEHLLLPYRFSSSSTYSSDSSPLNPSGSRGRKRGSQVSSQLVREGSSDVLLLRFFMQAREKDKEWTWLQSARHAVVEAGARVKMEAVALANQIGDAISPQDATSAAAQAVQEEKKAAGGGWWSNPFKSLRQGVEAPLRAKPTPGTWSSGEVHAELTRDEDGIFQYRRLYVDIPSSQAATRSRVWLVRREGEVVR